MVTDVCATQVLMLFITWIKYPYLHPTHFPFCIQLTQFTSLLSQLGTIQYPSESTNEGWHCKHIVFTGAHGAHI